MDPMADHPEPRSGSRDHPVYEIVVRGRVQGMLLQALEGFDVVPGRPQTTCFRGPIEDQAGLQRVLQRILACNLSLASVRRIDVETPGGAG
jgi:hypothetical protein